MRRFLCYLTCIRLLISSRAGTNRVLLPEKTYFPSYVRNINELPSNISTMIRLRVTPDIDIGAHIQTKTSM